VLDLEYSNLTGRRCLVSRKKGVGLFCFKRMTWKLKRTKQCAKCPWRLDVDPLDIPNGYSVDKHRNLECTIAKNPLQSAFVGKISVMACHESHDAHCIGWLVNQLGPGNNIGLRIQMLSCENGNRLKTIGEQHERFEDTLPY
jgi:hypothetical protein